jgi:hypothetical protein
MSKELRDYISDYDEGKEMTSVEMGGISQGYEIAIQECAIEIMRSLQSIALPLPEDKESFSNIVSISADSAVDALDKIHGFSGAQVGAAKNIAAIFWKQTPEKALKMMEDKDPSRLMTIKKGDDGNLVLIKCNIDEK